MIATTDIGHQLRASVALERFKKGEPGVYSDIDFRTYLALDAVNWHLLEPFRQSSRNGRHQMLLPDDASEAQAAGGAFHAAVLEPERFAREYVVMPEFEGHPNSNVHKAAKAAWIEANAAKVHLTGPEKAENEAMSRAVWEHPAASEIVSGKGRNELSVIWKDPETSALCKGRIDRLCRVAARVLDPLASNPDAEVIALPDLKTTRKVKLPGWEYERRTHGYHGQLAMYVDGIYAHNPAPVVPLWIAVENCNSFDVVVYRANEALIEHGRILYRGLLRQLLECRAKKRWPGISNLVLTMSPTAWEQKEVDGGDQ